MTIAEKLSQNPLTYFVGGEPTGGQHVRAHQNLFRIDANASFGLFSGKKLPVNYRETQVHSWPLRSSHSHDAPKKLSNQTDGWMCSRASYWVHVMAANWNSPAWTQLRKCEKPCHEKPQLCNWRVAPACSNETKPGQRTKTQHRQKWLNVITNQKGTNAAAEAWDISLLH